MTRSLAIVVRTRNHASCIGETLRRLYDQGGLRDTVSEVLYVDLGSTDGTVGILKQYQPEKLIQLEPARFGLGAALNLGMRETTADWVVFLSGDAWAEEHWLENLTAYLPLNSGVAAVASRQKPQPGCRDVYARSQHQRFGSDRPSGLLGSHHSVSATAISREVWQNERFRDDLPACEMEEWASRVESLGWKVLMAPEAQVLHSRNYTVAEAYQHAYAEALAWSLIDTGGSWRGRKLPSLARTCWMDAKYSFEQGNVLEVPFSVAVRIAQHLGEHRGFAAVEHAGNDRPMGNTQAV